MALVGQSVNTPTIEWPWRREDLADCLSALANPVCQVRAWLSREIDQNRYFTCFDHCVEFLFDDTDLATDPSSYIGLILVDEAEALPVREVGAAIDSLLDRYGTTLSDEAYIRTPEWIAVLYTARRALDLLSENERRRNREAP